MTATTTQATTSSADGTTLAYDTTVAGIALSSARTGGPSTGGPASGIALVVVDGALTCRLPDVLALAALLPATVVRYDRRGRGGSSDTPPYAVEREVEDAAAVIDAVGGRAVLLGVRSGAFLALRAAADLGPDRVAAVAVHEPPYDVASGEPAADPRQILDVEDRVRAGDPGGAVEIFLDALGMPARYLPGMRSSPSWASLEAVAPSLAYDGRVMRSVTSGRDALVARWQDITQPVLVADGGASPGFVRAAADSLARVLPHAHRVTLPGRAPHRGPDRGPDSSHARTGPAGPGRGRSDPDDTSHGLDAAALAPALGALLRHCGPGDPGR